MGISHAEQTIIFSELEIKLSPVDNGRWNDVEYNFSDKEIESLSIIGKENIIKLINYFTINGNDVEHPEEFVQLSSPNLNIKNENTINHLKSYNKTRIAHVINPYLVDGAVDKIQNKTIESISIALDMASTVSSVELISVIHDKDFYSIPCMASRHIYLDRYIGDLLETSRYYLPLLGEVIQKLHQFSKKH